MATTPAPDRYAVAGLARLISLIATVVFITLAILGLNFYFGGRLVLTTVVGVTGATALARALIVMCRCKASRQGSHRVRERLAAFTALLVMAGSSVFVSNFIGIYAHRHELRSAMRETVEALGLLDSDYHSYAQARTAAAPKRLRPTLALLLYPDREREIWAERHAWLDGLKDDEVWNVFLPANALALNGAATQWADEYVQVSSVILADEPASSAPFVYDVTRSRLSALLSDSQRYGFPDARGAAAVIVLSALMLLCYALIRRPSSDVEGTFECRV